MLRRTCIVFAASMALAGCNLMTKEEALKDDSSNPYYKQAQQDLDNNDPKAAAGDYETALSTNPKLAGAHYELGIIYGDKLSDPISSIFHFQRYLELDPASDKKDQVQALIDKQSQAFAASLPNSTPATQNSDDLAKLQSDNAGLKKQVTDATHTIALLQAQLKHRNHLRPTPIAVSNPPPAPAADATSAPAPVVAADPAPPPTNAVSPTPAPPRAVAVDTNSPDVNAVPPPTNGVTAPAGPSRSYTVVKGDSIWKIAHKMYPGDTKNGEDKIREANKEALAGKFLKPGQVLAIPQ
jgi:nucleoid-associated protein YgaU